MISSNEIAHTSFVVETEFSASAKHVFRFWSEAELKARWNGCHPDWVILEDRFDFRVRGTEVKRWRTPDGDEQTFHAFYLDVVPERRIVYAYEMSFAGTRLSASLVTVDFRATARKTRIIFTEQVAILSGGIAAIGPRALGTEEGLDRLGAIIEDGLR